MAGSSNILRKPLHPEDADLAVLYKSYPNRNPNLLNRMDTAEKSPDKINISCTYVAHEDSLEKSDLDVNEATDILLKLSITLDPCM